MPLKLVAALVMLASTQAEIQRPSSCLSPLPRHKITQKMHGLPAHSLASVEKPAPDAAVEVRALARQRREHAAWDAAPGRPAEAPRRAPGGAGGRRRLGESIRRSFPSGYFI